MSPWPLLHRPELSFHQFVNNHFEPNRFGWIVLIPLGAAGWGTRRSKKQRKANSLIFLPGMCHWGVCLSHTAARAFHSVFLNSWGWLNQEEPHKRQTLTAVMSLKHNRETSFRLIVSPQVLNPKKKGKKKKKYLNSGTVSLYTFAYGRRFYWNIKLIDTLLSFCFSCT